MALLIPKSREKANLFRLSQFQDTNNVRDLSEKMFETKGKLKVAK